MHYIDYFFSIEIGFWFMPLRLQISFPIKSPLIFPDFTPSPKSLILCVPINLTFWFANEWEG